MEDLTFMQYAAVMGMNTDLTPTGNDSQMLPRHFSLHISLPKYQTVGSLPI
jgi:hypothetical protein